MRRMSSPLDYVDRARYPIDAPESLQFAALVARAQRELAANGACELPGFVTPEGVQRAIAESSGLIPNAYHSRSAGTVYNVARDNDSLPDDHARRLVQRTSLGVIAYDQIPRRHLVRELYEDATLMSFIGAVLGLPTLYRYADPLGAINIAVMNDGDVLGWHFDQTDFVTSIPLVPSERGGTFEFHPLIRSDTDEAYDAVRAALLGHTPPSALAMTAGSLLLFKGRHTLHRVSPIEGKTARLVALLAYDAKPGTDSTAVLKRARYGRTETYAQTP
jgi:hypothetical protein